MKQGSCFLALVVLTLGLFSLPTEADAAGPPPIAAMQFGNEGVGPEGKGFDHPSNHAVDHVYPRNVTIAAGGTVVFRLPGGVHQVAIYGDGTSPNDIDVDGPRTNFGGCPLTDRYIDDPKNRIAVLADPPCAAGPGLVQYTFNEPGRYLVICTFDSHFINWNMYGWVTVK